MMSSLFAESWERKKVDAKRNDTDTTIIRYSGSPSTESLMIWEKGTLLFTMEFIRLKSSTASTSITQMKSVMRAVLMIDLTIYLDTIFMLLPLHCQQYDSEGKHDGITDPHEPGTGK